MGNSGSRYHFGGPRFGSRGYHFMYGGGSRRSGPRTLSSRSSGQVEEAKNTFLHLVFETDFDFMPATAKLKKQIFGHMTKDARVTVRAYVKSMNATSVFRANKNRFRGQNRVFEGSVTITKATKEYILENKPESFRELYVIAELSLCSLLCFAGIPHTDAKGWILDDVEQNEFAELKDIEQIQSYLTKKALIWKKPIHVTEYNEFQGKTPKDLESKLRNRDLALLSLCDDHEEIKKKNNKKSKRSNNTNRNNTNNKRIERIQEIDDEEEEKDEDEDSDVDAPICVNCGELNPEFRCSGCHITPYCSRECQNKHWRSEHRAQCKVNRHKSQKREKEENEEVEKEQEEDDDLVILKADNKENKNQSNKRTLYSYWNKLDLETRPKKKRKLN